jgi:hypothetical protein
MSLIWMTHDYRHKMNIWGKSVCSLHFVLHILHKDCLNTSCIFNWIAAIQCYRTLYQCHCMDPVITCTKQEHTFTVLQYLFCETFFKIWNEGDTDIIVTSQVSLLTLRKQSQFNWFLMVPSITTKFQYVNSPFFFLLTTCFGPYGPSSGEIYN